MELHEYQRVINMINEKLDEVGRNQQELADAVGITGGTLSKYLANKQQAPYERLRQMWDVVNEWEDRQTTPACELMSREFVTVTLGDTYSDAAEKMFSDPETDEYFSQLPVRESEGGRIVGILTDTDLMRVQNPDDVIEDVDRQPITVGPDTSRRLVEDILEEGHPAVLVMDGDEPVGIITKYDLLEKGPLAPSG